MNEKREFPFIINSLKDEKYTEWKESRDFYTKTLGNHFLALSENEISCVFLKWEVDFKELVNEDNLGLQATSLLIFSILYYFRRSFEHAKTLFPLIKRFSLSTNRNIVHIFAKTVYYLMIETTNSQEYFTNEVISIIRAMIPERSEKQMEKIQERRLRRQSEGTYEQNNKLTTIYYNAFLLLLKLSKISTDNILDITITHISDIIISICSLDNELSLVASKVLEMHLRILPEEIAINFANEKFHLCIETMQQSKDRPTHGPVILASIIYSVYRSVVSVEKIIESCMELLPNCDDVTGKVWYNFLAKLSYKNKELFTLEFVDIVCDSISSKISNQNDTDFLLVQLMKIIRNIDAASIPFDKVVEITRTVISQPQSTPSSVENSYIILKNLLSKFPDKILDEWFFANAQPLVQVVHLLKRQTMYFLLMTPMLQQWCAEGMVHNMSVSSTTLAIYILKTFGNNLFTSSQEVLEQLKLLARSNNEKIRYKAISAMPSVDKELSKNYLIQFALYDPSKIVRVAAIKLLQTQEFDNPKLFIPLIADRSFSVKKEAIPLISKLFNENPKLLDSDIFYFINNFMSQYISLLNSPQLQKACSTLHLFVQYFPSVCALLAPKIIWISTIILLDGEEIKDFQEVTKISEQHSLNSVDLNKYKIEGFSFTDPLKDKGVYWQKIFLIDNESHMEMQKTALFNVFSLLSEQVLPFILQVGPAFIKNLSRKHSNELYISAIKALTQITITSQCKFKLTSIFPDLLPALVGLLSGMGSNETCVEALRLIGTIGSPGSIAVQTAFKEIPAESIASPSQPSFFADYTLKLLTPLLETTASSVIFTAVTSILTKNNELTLKRVGPIFTLFRKALESESDYSKVFQELEVIVLYCTLPIAQFVDQFEEILKKHFLTIDCLNLCITLSFKLRLEFAKIGSNMFPLVLSNLDNDDIAITKKILKLAAFLVIFQEQEVVPLVHAITRAFFMKGNPSPEPYVNAALKTLTMLVQHYPMDFCGVQISILCFRQLRINPSEKVIDLLINLCLFGGLDVEFAEQEMRFVNMTLPHLTDIRNHHMIGKPTIEQVIFIKNYSPKLNTERIKSCLPKINKPNKDIFSKYPPPFYNAMEEWLENMIPLVVQNSPSISIRSCSEVIAQFPSFKHDIFPVAFLSCWVQTSEAVKREFSSTIEAALVKFSPSGIGTTLPYLANILDRSGVPFLIPDTIISVASSSAALALYQLERSIHSNPASPILIKRLLTLNTRIGRIETARGLLKSAGKKISRSETGSWYEQLNEWEKALNIYLSQKNQNVPALVRCYANLEQWETVRQLSFHFDSMPQQEKNSTAIWFAYAFFHSREMDKAERYVGYLDKRDDLMSIIVSSLYYIQRGQYQTAKNVINRGFNGLVKDRKIFSGTDTNIASKYLSAAQHFVELEECIKIKTSNLNTAPSIWENRLENYAEESDAWTNLIDIRLLVLSPADHAESCIKMISVLRKERKWRIIDSYLNRLKSVIDFPASIIERIKIIWARGKKDEAIMQIDHFSKSLCCKTEAELKQLISEEDNENSIKFLSNIDYDESRGDNLMAKYKEYLNKWNIDEQIRCRVMRLNASWRYNLYKAKTASDSSLSDIIALFGNCLELNSSDFKVWSGWAYACSRALSHSTDERPKYAQNAIKGFLKASKLDPQNILQYLCQVFAIIVRYCESFELPLEITQEITSLPPTSVIQIIPQIIIHITHSSSHIRKIVKEVITKFSEKHFEAVVYPLNVISLLPSEEKASIAKEAMLLLSSKHTEIYRDATLFINGMHKSAVCWCERWIQALSNAFKAPINTKASFQIIEDQFKAEHQQLCEFDEGIRNALKNALHRTRDQFKQAVRRSCNVFIMREIMAPFARDLHAKMNTIDAIYLSKVSSELAEKKGFFLSVPGMYDVVDKAPMIDHIEPRLELYNTQARPRLLFIWDTDGIRRKFLLKGNEDLRLDQRIMQFFSLINSLLKTNRNTRAFGVQIAMYAIVPFAPNAGLISWVTGADTMKQIINDFKIQRNRPTGVERQCAKEYTSTNVQLLSALQQLEFHEMVCSKTPADELRESMWIHAKSPALWVQHTRNFTNSTALMSIAGYIIGLGDRHLSNIMVQRHTGTVVHIDFGESFESASLRQNFPEQVPFRMTRLIVNALEGGSVEGIFRSSCEDVLYVLRENISPVIAQLEIFVHEPIFTSRSEHRDQHQILSRVSQKISGGDYCYGGDESKDMTVSEQVRVLISAASDKARYCRHFIGWQPTC